MPGEIRTGPSRPTLSPAWKGNEPPEGGLSEKKERPVILDTSIQIARVVHGPKTKKRIRERLARHEQAVSSLVVRQEFKRRLLGEAEYLLRMLHRYRSF